MKYITQQRTSKSHTRTFGKWMGDFICDCLELPDMNNLKDISCIPAGVYNLKQIISPRHGVPYYQFQNVPGRSGVEVDHANSPDELLGCVAIGRGFSDIDGDGENEIINSKKTWDEFMKAMNGEDIQLIIIDIPTLNS